MPSPEPFPIADFTEGLFEAKEPWIAPRTAFEELKNGRVFRGRLRKRKGFQRFSQLGVPDTDVHAAIFTSSFGFTTEFQPVLPGEDSPSLYKVTIDDGVVTVSDDGAGQFFNGPTPVGTINYLTGVWNISAWPGGIPAGNSVTVTYEYQRDLPVMGIEGYFPQQGGEFLIAFDTRGIWQYNAVQERFYKIFTDVWNADEETLVDGTVTSSDFIWTEVFEENLVICNGIDSVYIYDAVGSTLTVIVTGALTINTALLAFKFKGRLVLLNTTEGGSLKPQRARYTKVNPTLGGPAVGHMASDWPAENFADAPTTDHIVSAAFLGDELIVFFERSVWKLQASEDRRAPFLWIKVADTEGSFAPLSTVDFSDELVTQGPVGLVSTDGIDIQDASPQIPDFSLEYNQNKFAYGYGVVIEEDRNILWTYVAAADETVAQLLALQYDDNSFSIWTWPFLVYGYYTQANDLLWDDIGTDFDDTHFPFDERIQRAGFPTVLGGDRDGQIYQVNTDDQDALEDIAAAGRVVASGIDISFEAITKRLNPYPWVRARLHYLDVIMDPTTVDVQFQFFRNYDTAPYKTATITPSGSVAHEKVSRRILVNTIGEFHKIKIVHSGTGDLAIDALIPWFSPSAKRRQAGR